MTVTNEANRLWSFTSVIKKKMRSLVFSREICLLMYKRRYPTSLTVSKDVLGATATMLYTHRAHKLVKIVILMSHIYHLLKRKRE